MRSCCAPAALGAASALPQPKEHHPITVIVGHRREVQPPSGVRILRRVGFAGELQPWTYPPRQRAAYAALDAAAELDDESDAYALLAGLVQRGTVTPERVRSAVGARRRVRGRSLLLGLLEDLETGACSVLEREYLRRVERSHGLPKPERQAADSIGGRTSPRDLLYRQYGLVIELDGRAFHDTAAARTADGVRDLSAAAVRDLRTVRITTGQVLGDACRTAVAVEALLRRGGWGGHITTCPRCAKSGSSATA